MKCSPSNSELASQAFPPPALELRPGLRRVLGKKDGAPFPEVSGL